jgi:uncharacterized protein
MQDDIRFALEETRTWAVVGCSPDPGRDSHRIAALLQRRGFRVIPVNPAASEILGERCFATVRDIGEPVDVVDVFRRPEFCPEVAEQAAAAGAKALWLQLGIVSPEARAIAERAGMEYVENACTAVVHRLVVRP